MTMIKPPETLTAEQLARRAPDFTPGSGYPSRGELIGPAWAAAWWLLMDRSKAGPISRDVLTAEMQRAAPIQDKTAWNLLRQAHNVGLVTRRLDGPNGQARYRVKIRA